MRANDKTFADSLLWQDVDELVARADEVVEKGLLFTVVAGQELTRQPS